MKPSRTFDPSKFKASAAEYSSSDEDGDDDDDYTRPSTDPRADEFADFNPRKRRRTGRDAKESAALGIFGSDSDDDGPARRSKRKDLRSKGMSFVTSADDAPKAPADEDMDDDDELDERPTMRAHLGDDEEDEGQEEEDSTPGIGLGFKPASSASEGWAGLGQPPNGNAGANGLGAFSSPGARASHKPFLKSTFDSSKPLGPSFVPSSANQPVLDTTKAAATPTRQNRAQTSAFSTKNGKTKINANSFGARMMAKMGYQQGQGLGVENTGRQAIITAPLRPQRVGLGAVKEKTDQERQEEKRQARARGETVVDSDEEEQKRKAERRKKKFLSGGLRSGTGSAASTPKREKPKYMTMDEVKKIAPGLKIPDAFTPILDMTGPGGAKKMLTTASGLMTPTGGTTEDDEERKSKKLVRQAHNDFMAILDEWQELQDSKTFTDLQLQHERQELEALQKDVESHQQVAEILDELLQLEQPDEDVVIDDGGHTKQRWDQIMTCLRKANDIVLALSNQAIKDEVTATAVAALHPVMKNMVDNWDPIQSPRADYTSDIDSIKSLLGLEKSAAIPQARSSATPYESMMHKIWLPHVARAVQEWRVRDTAPMLTLYESWQSVLPGFVRTYFLRDVVRKLDEAIATWEPKRKKQQSLPHLWLFPWLQHLPFDQLDPKSSTGLVAHIKRKFRQLIDVWDFARGVIPGLEKWKNVLRPSKANDHWKPLVMNHVLPNMARYLRKNFDVQPSDQEPYLQVLTGVLEWRDVITPTMVAEVVVTEVFPKWHGILYQWLIDEDVSYEDVANWCEWWHHADGPLPAEIRDTVSIASEFERGLHTIERALDLFDLGEDPKSALAPPTAGPALKSQASNGSRHAQHAQLHHHKHESRATPVQHQEERTLRNVVEDWCQENDLQFMPERKQHHSEGPLYRITARGDGKGGKLGYFKGDKLFLLVRSGVEEFGESEGDLDRLMTHVM